MHAKIQWIDKASFSAQADSGHTLTLDGPPDAGGENRGPRPMELMLMGLGGCTSFDVVNILTRSRQQVVDCETELTATRAQDVPNVFETIQIHFKVTGRNLDAKKVARAVKLSAEKYCSASIMLERGGVDISHTHEIIDMPSEAPE